MMKGDLHPLAEPIELVHRDRPAERAVVLLHGFTNSPGQWREFAALLHADGRNVFVPRYPHHGLADRLSDDLARLTKAELVSAAQHTLERAAATAERVSVVGLSLGGLLAGWLAHRRPEVDVAVLVAPMFEPRIVPSPLVGPIRRLAAAAPNAWIWWDLRARASLPPAYGYPRFPTRAFAAMLHVAEDVKRDARRAAPVARALAVVTNAADTAVDNRATARVVGRWRGHGAGVLTHEFPRQAALPHDLVDPGNEGADVEAVYPVLLDVLRRAEAGTGA